jgi:two-component system OmpR family sensor kinase
VADQSLYSGSPLDIAVVYGVLSGSYILISDRLVAATIDDPQLATTVQTGKGWLFVLGSAVVIYALVDRSRQSLERTNERLDRALQQTTVLHRILRHNLRNSCNVISGNAEIIAANVRADGGETATAETEDATGERQPGPDSEECLETIREQTAELVTITEKTRKLRDFVLEQESSEPIDLAELVRERIADAREQYPSATFETDLPGSLRLETDPRITEAIDELFENAVEHSDREEVTIQVELQRRPDGTVRLDVADDGPGMPEMERAVLAEGMESPTFHSQGLGLWITRTLVLAADGEIRIVDNEPRGTIVRIVFPC